RDVSRYRLSMLRRFRHDKFDLAAAGILTEGFDQLPNAAHQLGLALGKFLSSLCWKVQDCRGGGTRDMCRKRQGTCLEWPVTLQRVGDFARNALGDAVVVAIAIDLYVGTGYRVTSILLPINIVPLSSSSIQYLYSLSLLSSAPH